MFDAHLAYLCSQGYYLVTVSELVRMLGNSSNPLPERLGVISFDDGFEDFYTHAMPLLQGHHVPATLYVTTDYIGQTSRWLAAEGESHKPMMTWSQIREVAGQSVEIGAHSLSHPALDILDRNSAWREIDGSKRVLESGLHRNISSFAYPHGYHTQETRALVEKAGFTSACAVKNSISDPEDDPFALARIIISHDVDVPLLARLLNGEGLVPKHKRERLATVGWRVARRVLSLLST